MIRTARVIGKTYRGVVKVSKYAAWASFVVVMVISEVVIATIHPVVKVVKMIPRAVPNLRPYTTEYEVAIPGALVYNVQKKRVTYEEEAELRHLRIREKIPIPRMKFYPGSKWKMNVKVYRVDGSSPIHTIVLSDEIVRGRRVEQFKKLYVTENAEALEVVRYNEWNEEEECIPYSIDDDAWDYSQRSKYSYS